MRICRYSQPGNDAIEVGLVEGDNVYNVHAIVDELPTLRWPIPAGDQFISHLDRLRPQLQMLRKNASPIPLADVILKSPIANPGKLLCGVGNYSPVKPARHDPRALGLLFKMTSAATGAGDGVTIRWLDRDTSHEMEIAIIIGRTGTRIPAENALSYVAGYAIGLDMTMQGKEFPSFCKSFDTYGVIGPWMVTADEIPDPSKLSFCLKVNGKIRQQQSLGELLLSVPELIEHVSSVMTLHPGDVIFSGTPPWSVAPVVPGDVMHAQMDVIGEMTVLVHSGEPGKQPNYC
jgi:2-keto-4-pentenoate hydratase/2-oxohepta-3-ene-1,7-dioic acid hydratase in catechol pathway